MKILALHCNSFRFYLAESVSGGDTRGKPDGQDVTTTFKECLLLLVSVEPGDETKTRAAAKSIRRIARKVEVDTIVVNGFAHLSDTLAPLDVSRHVLEELCHALLDETWSVTPTPLGWHKRMEFDVKGSVGAQKFVHA